jgi:hypothetical protein
MFEEDLKYGEQAERYVQKTLSEYFHESIKKNPVHSSRECDLIGEDHKFEVKCDRMFEKTGNVAMEISYKGHPSGILGTKSDYWVVVIKDDIWITPVKELRNWVFGDSPKPVKGGDNNDSKLVLMDSPTFRRIFYKIN